MTKDGTGNRAAASRGADASKPRRGDGQRSIQSVELGFQLIRCLEVAPGPLSLKELSDAAGMPASKAHLYLVSFRRIGLVFQEPSGKYALGPYAVQLGLAALRKLEVVGLARDILNDLRRATGDAAYLAVWGNRGPCIVCKADGPRQIPMTLQVGYVLPLLTTATGRIFLSYLPPDVTRDFIAVQKSARAHEKPAFSEKLLERIVNETKARGLARTDSLLNSGFTALSAPVFGHEGAISAAITVVGPSGKTDVTYTGENARLLREAARHLSKQLGWQESA